MVIAFTDANMCVRDFNGATQCFKSDGSGSKDLTPCTYLCYRCCALE